MKPGCTCLSHKEGLIISNGSEKIKKRPCIAKRTISSKKMLYAIFFTSSGPVVQVPCPSGHTVTGRFYKNSVLKKVKEFYYSKRNDQAKDGQESTFYMTTPPLISVRLLSLFWLLKRTSFYFQGLRKCFLEIGISLEVLLAALFISVSDRYRKKTIYLLFATG